MMEKCSSKEKKFIFKYFKERFGIEKEVFKGHELFMSSRKMVFVGPKSIIKNPRVVCPGVSIFRFDNVKPTTNFFQTFGNYVNKSIIFLDKENVLKFIEQIGFFGKKEEREFPAFPHGGPLSDSINSP